MKQSTSIPVVICMGSNLGDRKTNLDLAQQQISDQAGRVIQASGIYETEPWGYRNQPLFYNKVIEIETTKNAGEILKILLTIEAGMGRKRTFKNASRIIDLDILFFGNLCVESSDLTIPHPFLEQRRFVLEPLNEIYPDFVHPVLHKTVKELLMICKDPLEVSALHFQSI